VKDKSTGDIICICGIYGRYEYFVDYSYQSDAVTHLDAQAISRNDLIGLMNENSDTLVDNSGGKVDYEYPYVSPLNTGRGILYTVKERGNGGIELYDPETGKLEYICNIGGRYEYYFEKKYNSNVPLHRALMNDMIIQLIPDKKCKYFQRTILVDQNNNPYIKRPRADGGIDLISKEDGTLKYICNIGKRFYYLPYDEERVFYL
jgi:hypothetical protein